MTPNRFNNTVNIAIFVVLIVGVGVAAAALAVLVMALILSTSMSERTVQITMMTMFVIDYYNLCFGLPPSTNKPICLSLSLSVTVIGCGPNLHNAAYDVYLLRCVSTMIITVMAM